MSGNLKDTLSHYRIAEERDTLGAARPQTCGKGFHPLHPNKRNYSVVKTRHLPLAALGFTKV